jgi:dephospho-CoA kinase
MQVIGILGGVASGKSQVTRMLAELGCGVLDADRAGHEVLTHDEVKRAIRDRWGDRVFDAAGEVDRQAVAAIVFGHNQAQATKPNAAQLHVSSDQAAERTFLEQLTHGRIAVILQRQAAALKAAGQASAIVLDAALLVEAGWDAMCDVLVYVDAPREARLSRALGRGWTQTDFDAREAAQETLQAKRELADFKIDNSGDLQQLRSQVERFWRWFSAAYPT